MWARKHLNSQITQLDVQDNKLRQINIMIKKKQSYVYIFNNYALVNFLDKKNFIIVIILWFHVHFLRGFIFKISD